MKKPLLLGISLLSLGLISGIYAQTTGVTGSLVDKMKAVAHNFSLSSVLNPTDTGLTSDPVKGKKTGDILTAGEWNRMLELVADGSAGGSVNYLQLATPVSVNFTEGGKVPFTEIVSQKGTQITQNGGEITLKGGSSYRISADLRLTSPNSGIGYTIVEKSSGTGVGVFGANYTGTYTGSWGGTSALALVSPTVDTTYFIKTSSLSGTPFSTSGGGHFTVDELGGSAGGTTVAGGLALYKCTNAQSLDATNAPCYGASRNGGAGTNQYRVVSCTDNDGTRSYTMSSILNFGQLVTNKWAVSVNGGTIECDDGTVLVMDTQGGGSGVSSNSSWVNIPLTDTADFNPDCEYRVKMNQKGSLAEASVDDWIYHPTRVGTKVIMWDNSIVIKSATKNVLWWSWSSNDTYANVSQGWGRNITKIEKRCN